MNGVAADTVSRGLVRSWVSKQRAKLEEAQASGGLARAKLDIRDSFEWEFRDTEREKRLQVLAIFDQEIEAFCADMRLASVTVQQQVERKKSMSAFKLFCVIVFGVPLALFVLFVIGGLLTNGYQGH